MKVKTYFLVNVENLGFFPHFSLGSLDLNREIYQFIPLLFKLSSWFSTGVPRGTHPITLSLTRASGNKK